MITNQPAPPAPDSAPPVIGPGLAAVAGLRGLQVAALAISLAVFLTSCVMTAGHGEGGFLEGGVDPYGLQLLLFGWTSILVAPVYFLGWVANPLFVGALTLLWHRMHLAAAFCSLVALGLSLVPLVALMSYLAPTLRLVPPIALVFAGGRLELHLGYFLWVCSHAVLFTGAWLLWLSGPSSRTGPTNE